MSGTDRVRAACYWEGPARLFDGRSASSRPIQVAIGPDGLEIRDGEAAGRYGRGDLALIERSEDDSFFSLGLKPHPGFVLAFASPQAMEWLRSSALLRRPAFSGWSLAGKAAVLAAFLAVFSAFVYFVGLDLAADAAVRVLPRKADRLLGDAVIKGFAGDLAPIRDSAALSALEKSRIMVQGLAPGSPDSIRILVAADTSVKNAFAFPGGYILVYSGMLRLLETQEEWAGLLAHEGGHIHLRHGMRRIVRGSILAIGASLVFGDVSGLGSVLMDNAGTLVNLSYGRRDESEADAFARRSLEEGGYSAAGLATLFGKLLALQQMPSWAAFLSTHPATEDRISALRGAAGKGSGSGDPGAGPGKALLTAGEWAALKKL